MSRVTLQVHTELKNRVVWLRIMLFLLDAMNHPIVTSHDAQVTARGVSRDCLYLLQYSIY